MITIPTCRFSDAMFVLGIIFTLLSLLWFFASLVGSLGYRGANPYVGISFLSLLVSCCIMVVGNKKVVDPDYLIIFLNKFYEKVNLDKKD